MSADVGLAGRSVAPGTGRRCRGAVGCGRSMAAALVWGRYRDSRVDGRPVPHAFLCGPLPFSFVEKEKTAPLGECGLLYERETGAERSEYLIGAFPLPVQFCCRPCFATPPGYCGALFRVQPQRSFWGGLLSEWNGYSAREGRDGDTTPRRPRFGALSTPCGALFRKGRGEAPAGARR